MPDLWHTFNRFRYLYTRPVTGALTRLRVLPRVRHGAQSVVNTRLWIDPHPRRARSWTDGFGNCVVEVEHPCLSSHLEVEAEFCTTALPVSPGCGIPVPAAPIPAERDVVAEARRLFLPL